jgi:hypothetical protein
MSGLASFLIIRMWFAKAVDDFNKNIVSGGKNAPELIATTSNGFTSEYHMNEVQSSAPSDVFPVVWVAYAFYGIPLIASLAKINVHASEGKY